MHDWDLLPFLPEWRDHPVVEIGTGYGYLTEYLLERGFTNVTAVDICEGLLVAVQQRLGSRLAAAHCCDARTFLDRFDGRFGLIVMFDLIEHVPLDEAFDLLQAAHRGMAQGGWIVLRTPNMANLRGCYDRYGDLTHCHGYTALTLSQLLELAGFANPTVCVRRRRRTWLGQGAQIMNSLVHRFLDLISRGTPSETYRQQLVMRAQRI